MMTIDNDNSVSARCASGKRFFLGWGGSYVLDGSALVPGLAQ